MYLTYFLSLYPFAVPKPDFLYKTSSLQWGRGGGRHQFWCRKQILVLNNFHAFSYIKKNFQKKKKNSLPTVPKKYWDVSGNKTFIFFGLNAKFCQRKSMPEKESIMVVRWEFKIPASLVMPNSYPRDRIFNQHLSQPLKILIFLFNHWLSIRSFGRRVYFSKLFRWHIPVSWNIYQSVYIIKVQHHWGGAKAAYVFCDQNTCFHGNRKFR